MLLADVGCNSSESNLTSCCATEIPTNLHCYNGVYAGVRCRYNNSNKCTYECDAL